MRTAGWRAGAALLVSALATCGSACSQEQSTTTRSGSASAEAVEAMPARTPAPSSSPVADPPASPPPSASDGGPPVREVSASDPAGDVAVPEAGPWFVPSTDLVAFRASYLPAARAMRLRIEVAELRGDRHGRDRFQLGITVANDHGPWRAVHFESNPWEGPSVATQAGRTTETCAGATSESDLAADVVLLTVPVACLAPGQRSAHLSVSTDGQQVFRNRWSVQAGSDALTTTRLLRTR